MQFLKWFWTRKETNFSTVVLQSIFMESVSLGPAYITWLKYPGKSFFSEGLEQIKMHCPEHHGWGWLGNDMTISLKLNSLGNI